MIIQGPSPVVFGPTVSQVQVTTATFDLTQKTYDIEYLNPATGHTKSARGATPAAVQTALENHVVNAIQAAEGWVSAPTVTTP